MQLVKAMYGVFFIIKTSKQTKHDYWVKGLISPDSPVIIIRSVLNQSQGFLRKITRRPVHIHRTPVEIQLT